MKLPFQKMVEAAPFILKNSCIFSKCDNVIEYLHIFSLVWNFAQMWKINMKREYSITIFLREKSLDLKKN
jgi:hypothetical protein